MRELSGVKKMFDIFIEIWVGGVYVFVKDHSLHCMFKICDFIVCKVYLKIKHTHVHTCTREVESP